ncbi:hypothetical protein [Rhizobium leguminosarum]|uniref:hypothetical protein n=1 Tax=Rhizobium leguminosarum TaxID=384 RepID=UPI000CF4A8F0|nr:hypothetical protein [Rhizobium leguminosarum]
MNADMIAAWAVGNGFHAMDSGKSVITIEIKRMSILLIDERQGLRPRLISRLFKDISLTRGSSRLQGLVLDRNPTH